MQWTSLIISIISLGISSFIAFRQLKYIKNQDKLNSLLSDKEKRKIESLDIADINAKLVRAGTNNIQVTNDGEYTAKNVSLTFPEDNSWNVNTDIFPMTLQPSQAVNLIMSKTLSSKRKQVFLFTWEDKKGRKEKSIELA